MTYATLTDLQATIPAAALVNVAVGSQTAALERAFEEINSYIEPQYGLPLTTWPKRLTHVECVIASWYLMSLRGYNPNQGAGHDNQFYIAYQDAVSWLKQVGSGSASLPGASTADSTPGYSEGLPRVVSGTGGVLVGPGGCYSGGSRTSRGI
jgi:hypothetical protein